MGPAELARALEARLEAELSPGRAAHSRGVAALTAELCARHGLDPERGRAAGLAHDLCKERPLPEQRALAAIWAAEGPGLEPGSSLLGDRLVHGPAAAGLLIRDYGVADGELLEALARHTVGRECMGLLAILVYAADKLEPGRGRGDPGFRERCLGLGPEELFLAVLEDTVSWLRKRSFEIAPETLLLLDSLRSRVECL